MDFQECSKSDWKLFRSRIAEWQEKYMDRLNKEYITLLSGDEKPSEKFWKLEERIKKDRKHPGVIIEVRKLSMIYNIITLIQDGVIGVEELDGFSEELLEKVNFILNNV